MTRGLPVSAVQTRAARDSAGAGIRRAMLGAMGTTAVAVASVCLWRGFDEAKAFTLANIAWQYLEIFGLSLAPVIVIGAASTQISGTFVRRFIYLSGSALAFYSLGTLGIWMLMSFNPFGGEDAGSPINQQGWWWIVSGSVLVPNLVGIFFLARSHGSARAVVPQQ